MNGNLFANVEIIKGLTYTNNFGFGVNFYEMDDFKPYYFINTTQNNKVIQVSRQLDRTFKWNWQHVLDYKMTLHKQHSIDVMAGFEASEWLYKGLSGQADSLLTNGATPEYQYLDATLRDYGSEYSYAGGGMGHGSKYAYFGRLNYEYNNLFLAQVSYRYEGSTNFGKDHRFGGFPGFSAGFKFSELNAVKDNVPYLSFGKLRFGWGHTGNDQIPGDKFSSLAGVSAGYGYPLGGAGSAGFYEDAYDERFLEVIRDFDRKSKPIAAICVGAMPIGKSGVLNGRKATTWDLNDGARRKQLADFGAQVQDSHLVVDGNIITSTGPATSIDVALKLIELLTDTHNVGEIKRNMRFLST